MLTLPLDIPPPPLFHDEAEANIIPHVSLFELLSKFDGVAERVVALFTLFLVVYVLR